MTSENNRMVWLDGKFVKWENAQINVMSHSLHYGSAIFEGLRIYSTPRGPCIYRLNDHTDRLFRSAKILRMEIPYTKDKINHIQKELVKKNQLKHGYIRPIVFYGPEGLGLHTQKLVSHVAIAVWPLGAYLGDDKRKNGIRVLTSSYNRYNVNSTFVKAKASGNYLNSILALQEVIANGCDEALFLDNQGFVAEGSGENIFIVKNNALYTPECTSSLRGITRDTIFSLANDLNVSAIEKRITRDEVYIADEAFFCGTAAEVLPIVEMDHRKIGTGLVGSITHKLQTLFFESVTGQNDSYTKWLTPV